MYEKSSSLPEDLIFDRTLDEMYKQNEKKK